jgi:hypothetical protein
MDRQQCLSYLESMSAISRSLTEFRNEPLADFSVPANRRSMEEKKKKVRAELGREYDLLVGGERIKTAEKLRSLNPSHPSQVVGVHQSHAGAGRARGRVGIRLLRRMERDNRGGP